MLHAIRKDDVSAQIVSVIDKCDGFCEALHEVLAGNLVFVEPLINYLTHTFNDLPGKYPLIGEFFSEPRSPFRFPVCELASYFKYGSRQPQPHTWETISRNTRIPMYEAWKRVTLKHFGTGPLIDQTEFFAE